MTQKTLKPSEIDPGLVGVSLIMPCLNEARYIKECILSLLEGNYPVDLIEILVLDGQSTDGTRDILDELNRQWWQIHVIDNQGASKPKALNIGIDKAKHDVIMRIDAHAVYPPNYIRELVRSLHIYGADNVGGVRLNKTLGTGTIARALAAVLTHPFGVGDAKHYTGTDTPVESDIIFLFCTHKSLFDEVGGFDERLRRGQDREFNLRLSRLGKKMVLCPNVFSTYYARDQLAPFIRWAYQSGKTPFEISRLIGSNLLSIRNFVPLLFVLAIIALLAAGLWVPALRALLTVLLGFYILLGLVVGFTISDHDRPLSVKLFLPVGFFLWHFSYGLGALHGVVNWVVKYAVQGKEIP